MDVHVDMYPNVNDSLSLNQFRHYGLLRMRETATLPFRHHRLSCFSDKKAIETSGTGRLALRLSENSQGRSHGGDEE